MGQELAFQVTLTSVDCGGCGGTYAINERYRKQCADEGRAWTCPYCRTGWGYAGNGEVDRLRKERDAQMEAKNRALSDANTLRAEVTRLKKRVSNGTCPCCRRSFANLKRHMATKHKDYAAA